MTNIIVNRITIALLLSLCHSVLFAGLTGQTKAAWIASYIPACFKVQREMTSNFLLTDDRLSRYCTCLGVNASENTGIDNVLVSKVYKNEASYPKDLNVNASKYCGVNWGKFPSGAISRPISLNGHGLFDGKNRRFTAYRQLTFTKDWTPVETNELSNGKIILDINIHPASSENTATDVLNKVTFKLEKVEQLPDYPIRLGYDYQYKNDENGLLLTFNTEQGLLTTEYYNTAAGKMYQTHYIDSAVLICASLKAAKDKINETMLGSVVKEALLVAIKSRAGASYSGGNFYGTTSNGSTVGGTYTHYDNSWLGEHYSRGLDAFFNGTATSATINDELIKANCRY